eukprot:GILJ01000248.1.p1 GENE.GILJ01000248.1~~GILJ01000248.1.p1  ORF type:complete len:558 (-),score=52.53 GILJ01000248.1:73-1701(-)
MANRLASLCVLLLVGGTCCMAVSLQRQQRIASSLSAHDAPSAASSNGNYSVYGNHSAQLRPLSYLDPNSTVKNVTYQDGFPKPPVETPLPTQVPSSQRTGSDNNNGSSSQESSDSTSAAASGSVLSRDESINEALARLSPQEKQACACRNDGSFGSVCLNHDMFASGSWCYVTDYKNCPLTQTSYEAKLTNKNPTWRLCSRDEFLDAGDSCACAQDNTWGSFCGNPDSFFIGDWCTVANPLRCWRAVPDADNTREKWVPCRRSESAASVAMPPLTTGNPPVVRARMRQILLASLQQIAFGPAGSTTKQYRDKACTCADDKTWGGNCFNHDGFAQGSWCYVKDAANCPTALPDSRAPGRGWQLCTLGSDSSQPALDQVVNNMTASVVVDNDPCSCSQDGTWGSSCDNPDNKPIGPWCYVRTPAQCNNAYAVPGKQMKWRPCNRPAACECSEDGSFGSTCGNPNHFDEGNWCYVKNGHECAGARPSVIYGDKMYRLCSPEVAASADEIEAKAAAVMDAIAARVAQGYPNKKREAWEDGEVAVSP